MHLLKVARTGDRKPDAVNWASVAGASPAENANQTISGISTSIALRATITGYARTGGNAGGLSILVNGSIAATVTAAEGASVSAQVGPGESVRFQATKGLAGSGTNWSGTVTVIVAATGYVVDTFTVSCDAA